jgi:hypothetical protein
MSTLSFRKPEWLDTALGIAGFVMAVLSTLALLSPTIPIRASVYSTIGFGLIIILISIMFRPRHSLTLLPVDTFGREFERLVGYSHALFIYNPSRLPSASRTRISTLLTSGNTETLIIGDAFGLLQWMKGFSLEAAPHVSHSVVLSNGPSANAICVGVNKAKDKITVLVNTEASIARIAIRDSQAVETALQIIKANGRENAGRVHLELFPDPLITLTAVVSQQQRYNECFSELQSGQIVFHGNDVLVIQSQWIEARQFHKICALDITKDPSLLKTRVRYWKANERFVKNGGVIRRVFLATKLQTKDHLYMVAMKELIRFQRHLGVTVGAQLIDHLPSGCRRDCIIYDESVALVEHVQADTEYTLARSVAYFSRADIQSNLENFERVWSGEITGTPAEEVAEIWCPVES